ncbi:transcription factor IIIB 90 kDa subunit-like isoform X2 [Aphidius gifuensis]|nr:transcription factor IIIB 90 kDa subunit-like isoform X2 [Aphidius gifuensis]
MTRGRDKNLNYAACIYIACRIERIEYLLIDISEVLQIDVYELGKTYLHFTKELCISVPTFDPCLYVARYGRELDFGNKTKDVINTASRLVKRMKKDNIHTGRRPSGLCGAALLIAARLHDFNRTPTDIIKIVQVHESTLRKRLIEFGDTPSSALTLDEFFDIELEAEQDPPAFKAARKKDRERLEQLEHFDLNDFDDLQREIEQQLNEHTMSKSQKRKRKNTESIEEVDTNRFIEESTMNTINSYVSNKSSSLNDLSNNNEPVGLGPDVSAMGLASSLYDTSDKKTTIDPFESTSGELDITGLDDDELDSYILSEKATDTKASAWTVINADYLEQMKEKEAQRLKDIEDGKPEKKKRKTGSRKKNQIPASSAGEAIEKMLREKKISTKINYEVLKSLNTSVENKDSQDKLDEVVATSEIVRPSNVCSIRISNKPAPTIPSTSRSPKKDVKIETKIETKLSPKNQISFNDDEEGGEIDDYDEDNDEEAEPDEDDINRICRNSVDESYDYDDYY